MISTNRKDVRTTFAGLLSSALVGAGKPAQVVYGFRKGNIEGQTPVIVVSSLGTRRDQLSFQGTAPNYQIQVDVFVLYEDQAAGWTEQNAEDTLDDLDLGIAGVVQANQISAGKWDAITFTDWSERTDVSIGGVEYIRESAILEFN